MGTQRAQQALEIAAELCRIFEGYSSTPYICPAGYPTIGWGSTRYDNGRLVQLSDAPITKDYANELLYRDLENFFAATVKLCPGVVTDARRAAALVDFVYNLGPARLKASTLRRRVNAGDWQEAKTELMRWANGRDPKTGILRPLPGLVKRRAAEAALI